MIPEQRSGLSMANPLTLRESRVRRPVLKTFAKAPGDTRLPAPGRNESGDGDCPEHPDSRSINNLYLSLPRSTRNRREKLIERATEGRTAVRMTEIRSDIRPWIPQTA